jgi:YbbR domain-containing protein
MSWWRGVATVLTDLGLRLIAVVLAVAFLLHARTEAERETVLSVPLKVHNVPAGLMVATDLPDHVDVRLKGSVNALVRLRLAPPEVNLDLADARPGEVVQRRLTVGEVRMPVRSPIRVIEIVRPRIIPVGVDERLTREIRVLPAVTGIVTAGYTLGGVPGADPPQVQVSGPRRIVEALEVIRTEPLDLARVGTGDPTDVGLEPLPGVVTVIPPRVRLRLSLDRVGEATFRAIPVVVLHNRAVDRAIAEPTEISVTLRGATALLELLRPASLVARVDARNLLSGKHFLVISLAPPGEGISVVSLSPDHVAVTLE